MRALCFAWVYGAIDIWVAPVSFIVGCMAVGAIQDVACSGAFVDATAGTGSSFFAPANPFTVWVEGDGGADVGALCVDMVFASGVATVDLGELILAHGVAVLEVPSGVDGLGDVVGGEGFGAYFGFADGAVVVTEEEVDEVFDALVEELLVFVEGVLGPCVDEGGVAVVGCVFGDFVVGWEGEGVFVFYACASGVFRWVKLVEGGAFAVAFTGHAAVMGMVIVGVAGCDAGAGCCVGWESLKDEGEEACGAVFVEGHDEVAVAVGGAPFAGGCGMFRHGCLPRSCCSIICFTQ